MTHLTNLQPPPPMPYKLYRLAPDRRLSGYAETATDARALCKAGMVDDTTTFMEVWDNAIDRPLYSLERLPSGRLKQHGSLTS